jgi:membrane protein DedA with SNARE-associated domain
MAAILSLLITYRYLIIFPLGVIEGPIIAVICGLLVTLGILDWYVAYPLLVFADALGDWAYYALGRFGRPLIKRWGRYIGATPERLEQAHKHFKLNHFKMVAASKLIHAGGFLGIITAGTLKIPFLRFALQCLVISILQTGVLFVVGIFFGSAYERIGHYLDYYAAGTAVVVLIIATYFIVRWLKRPRA